MRGLGACLALAFALAGAPVLAQNAADNQPNSADDQTGAEQPTQGTIQSVYLEPHARITNTTCTPTRVSFTGKIKTDGPAFVTYRWLRSDGRRKDGVIQGSAVDGKTISTSWDQTSTMSGWVQLVVLSPKHVATPKTYFHVHCGTG